MSTSDLDLTIVFKDGTPPALGEGMPGSGRPGRWLAHHCGLLCPISLGLSRPWEHEVLAFADHGNAWSTYEGIGVRASLKLASHCAYGEDIRAAIPLPSLRWWARALWAELSQGAIRYLGQLRARQLGQESLLFPLYVPDLDGEFFGYDRIRRQARDGTVRPTTRGLVRAVLAGANATVAWRAGRFVVRKQDIAPAYRETIGGAWADFVERIDQTCRVELGYLLPEEPSARRLLRALCAEVPAFENHILAEFRAFLLEELVGEPEEARLPAELAGWLLNLVPDGVQALASSGLLPAEGREGRRQVAVRPCIHAWVARMLERVQYPDDGEVTIALRTLANSDTELVRRAAESTIHATSSPG